MTLKPLQEKHSHNINTFQWEKEGEQQEHAIPAPYEPVALHLFLIWAAKWQNFDPYEPLSGVGHGCRPRTFQELRPNNAGAAPSDRSAGAGTDRKGVEQGTTSFPQAPLVLQRLREVLCLMLTDGIPDVGPHGLHPVQGVGLFFRGK